MLLRHVLPRLAAIVALLASTFLAGHTSAALATVPGTCPPPTTSNVAPRMYAIDANWNMLLYLGDLHGHLTGGGLAWPGGGLWRGFHGIATGDYNGDGWPDVAGLDANNDMRLWAGSSSGQLSGEALMWPGGGLWANFKNIFSGDFDGDGHQDLAGVDAFGDLRLYRGDGAGHLVGGDLMWPGGRGVWGGFQKLTGGDYTGDGVPDVMGVDAYGHLNLYRGDGTGHLVLASGQAAWPGTGWNGFHTLTGTDLDNDGYADLLGIDANGDHRLYRGGGTGHIITTSGALAYAGGGLWFGFHYVAAAAPNLPALCLGGTRLAVWPLGDSITFGYSSQSGWGYEGPLAALLNQRAPMGAGWLFEGSINTGPGYWSQEGHGGWRIDTLDSNIASWLPNPPNGGVPVNLVLLDAGSNDAGQGYSGQTMLDRMSALLDHILALDPAARIEVAELTINGQNAGAIQAETDFDNGLPALVAAKGPQVTVVDMRGVHLSSDGVHPDDTGYTDMASRWYAAAAAAGWLP